MEAIPEGRTVAAAHCDLLAVIEDNYGVAVRFPSHFLYVFQIHDEGTMNAKECLGAIQQKTRRYAKRQLTWLRRENTFFKINLSSTPFSDAAEAAARCFVAASPKCGRIGS